MMGEHCRLLPILLYVENIKKKKKYIYIFIWLCGVLDAACGIYFPDQGLNPGPLHWEPGVLATGL